MSAREERYAQETGMTYLGNSEAEIEVNLTQTEKLELGDAQSQSIQEIKRLTAELDDIKKDYKNKIGNHEVIIDRSSKMLQDGFKVVPEKLPCYLDAVGKEKHWVNIETGEIKMSKPATRASPP